MTDRGTVGKITKYKNIVYWRILEFRSLSGTEGDFFWSPEMQHLGNVWKMRIYPRGTTSIPDSIMLQVWRTNVSGAKPVRFSIGIYKRDRSEEEFIRNERFDSDTSVCSGLLSFMLQDFLTSHWGDFSYEEELDITLNIWIDEPTSKEGRDLDPGESKRKELTDIPAEQGSRAHYDIKGDDSALRQDLENMLLSGDDHDVTIKVKDKQFSAHKNMLRTRSPVFSAMFKHQMKESADDSISIEDCDPESFGEFLRYVYAGRVQNLSPSNAMGLYYAGDKYEFLELKKMCVEYLKASLCTAGISDVISLAVRHSEKELLERAMEFFSKNLVAILSSVEWQRFAVSNPVQANEICLKAVKCRLGEN